MTKTIYTVETLRAGQPRPCADSEYEYLITVTREHYFKPFDQHTMRPWLLGGDVEAQIKEEEAMRARGHMSGGQPPEALRKAQRDWAVALVKALGQDFREKDDQDGRTGMEAAFYPTLKSLRIDAALGTIRALIVSAYTD